MELNFLNYFQQLANSLIPDDETIKKLNALKKIVLKCNKNNEALVIFLCTIPIMECTKTKGHQLSELH